MKMIKFSLSLFMLFVTCGCTANFTPSERVEDMLDRYIKNDEGIMQELSEYMDMQDLSLAQKEKYSQVIKNEYASIKYTIKNEQIDGDEAKVEVAIKVKDLYKTSKEASAYLRTHAPEFYTNGSYDRNKYVDYKLEKLHETNEYVDYTIFVNLKKVDGIWTIEQIDDVALEKIHGIYNYEADQE